MNNFIWIALEGIGGVGKTTQMEYLKDTLPNLYPDISIYFANEFSEDSKIGLALSSSAKKGIRVGNRAESNLLNHLLVIADRISCINKIHSNTSVVIYDRFILSDMAHALTDCKVNDSEILALLKDTFDSIYEPCFTGNSQPTIFYLYFKCSIDTACRRIEQRQNTKTSNPKVFLTYLSESYDTMLSCIDNPIYYIDTEKSPNLVHIDILNAVENILQKCDITKIK